jgi:endonuclease/exonuclease/phosphatase family metal-dependent hydrolase
VYGGRVALGVDALVGCAPIRLYAMHLDTRGLGDDGRARQGAAVRDPVIADCGEPPAAEEVVADFLAEGWQDAVPDDGGWTQLGEGFFPQRLDWIFHRGGLEPVDGEIVRRSIDASDHVPVVFRFAAPEEQ